jgi:sucrose-6F-phosphate phosphohydrolase
MKRLLLCTDLDRTLIPNGFQPESPSAKKRFARLAARPEICLAYVTGRHRELIADAIAEHGLPIPDFAIANVGSTIYRVDHPAGWHSWSDWDEHIATDWLDLSATELHSLLHDLPDLRLQEKEKQNRHKLSFYVPLEADIPALISQMDDRLRRASLHASLIWSIDEPAGTGLLDVLPESAGKLNAIRFLMGRENFSLRDTVFAGDSGNDLDVLLSDIPAVLVANADPEIKARLSRKKRAALYIATGGYLGMNGNYGAGILEGVAHFWPEADAWLHEL